MANKDKRKEERKIIGKKEKGNEGKSNMKERKREMKR